MAPRPITKAHREPNAVLLLQNAMAGGDELRQLHALSWRLDAA
jgi:hypothetical protein